MAFVTLGKRVITDRRKALIEDIKALEEVIRIQEQEARDDPEIMDRISQITQRSITGYNDCIKGIKQTFQIVAANFKSNEAMNERGKILMMQAKELEELAKQMCKPCEVRPEDVLQKARDIDELFARWASDPKFDLVPDHEKKTGLADMWQEVYMNARAI